MRKNGSYIQILTSAAAALGVVLVVLLGLSLLRSFFTPKIVGDMNDTSAVGEIVGTASSSPNEDIETPDMPGEDSGGAVFVPAPEITISAPPKDTLLVLEGTHPSSQLIPEGVVAVPYTRVRFVAPQNNSVDIEEVVVEHTGIFDDEIFTGITLLDESGKRMGTSTPLRADHKAYIDAEFRIPAGEARTITIAGDMAPDLEEHATVASFLAVVDVTATSDVDGDFPIVGTRQRVNTSLRVGQVELRDFDFSDDDIALNGEREVLGGISATAGTVENVLWKSVRFVQSGNISEEYITSLSARDSNGNVHSVSKNAFGQYVVTLNPPILMERGDTHSVILSGVVNGDSGSTIDFDITELIDVEFVGLNHNYVIRPTATMVDEDVRQTNMGSFGVTFPQFDAVERKVGKGRLIVRSATNTEPTSLFIGTATPTPVLHIGAEALGESVTFSQWNVGVTIDPIARIDGTPETLPLRFGFFEDGELFAEHVVTRNGIAQFTATTTIPIGAISRSIGIGLTEAWEVGDVITLTFIPEQDIIGAVGDVTGESIVVESEDTMVKEILIIAPPEVEVDEEVATSTPENTEE